MKVSTTLKGSELYRVSQFYKCFVYCDGDYCQLLFDISDYHQELFMGVNIYAAITGINVERKQKIVIKTNSTYRVFIELEQ